MDELKEILSKWAQHVKRRREGINCHLKIRLEELVIAERDEKNIADLIDIKIKLNLEIDKDGAYWEQKANANWFKLGDRNTAFFHKFTSQWRHGNHIGSLEYENGKRTSDEIEKELAHDFFCFIFCHH